MSFNRHYKSDYSGVKVSERGLFVVLKIENAKKSLIGYFLLEVLNGLGLELHLIKRGES